MRTALDTNILSALWSNETSAENIARCLGKARQDGAIVLSGVVYAELLAYPGATEEFVNQFTAETGIVIQFRCEDEVWIEAGRRFAKYVSRRRSSRAETPKRLIADFLVGSHALLQADRLMTLDASRYEKNFPDLSLYKLTPQTGKSGSSSVPRF
jgi:predicted nucleic acid-binding protein